MAHRDSSFRGAADPSPERERAGRGPVARAPGSEYGRVFVNTHLRRNKLAALALVALALGCGGGCATPKRTFQPAQDPNTLNEIEFVHYLAALPTVSMDEAYQAMLLLADGENSATDFDQRRSILVSRGVVRESWGLGLDDVLDKGTLAYMIVKTCKLSGGVNDALLGSWGLGDRRYALRTAIWHEMMPYGVPYHAVTGGELLAAITTAAEYLEPEGPADM